MFGSNDDDEDRDHRNRLIELSERQRRLQEMCEEALREDDGQGRKPSANPNTFLGRRVSRLEPPNSYDDLTGEVQSFRDPNSAARASSTNSVYRTSFDPTENLFPLPRTSLGPSKHADLGARSSLYTPLDNESGRANSIGINYTPMRRGESASVGRAESNFRERSHFNPNGMVETPFTGEPLNVRRPTGDGYKTGRGILPPPSDGTRSRSHSVPLPSRSGYEHVASHLPPPPPPPPARLSRPPPPPPVARSSTYTRMSPSEDPSHCLPISVGMPPPPPEEPRATVKNLQPPVLTSPFVFSEIARESPNAPSQKFVFSLNPPSAIESYRKYLTPSSYRNRKAAMENRDKQHNDSYTNLTNEYSSVSLNTSIRSTDERLAKWREKAHQKHHTVALKRRNRTTPPPLPEEIDATELHSDVGQGPWKSRNIPVPRQRTPTAPLPPPSTTESDDDGNSYTSWDFTSTNISVVDREERRIKSYFEKHEDPIRRPTKPDLKENRGFSAGPKVPEGVATNTVPSNAVMPIHAHSQPSFHPYAESSAGTKAFSHHGSTKKEQRSMPHSTSQPLATVNANVSVCSLTSATPNHVQSVQGVRNKMGKPIAAAEEKMEHEQDSFFDEDPEKGALRQLAQMKASDNVSQNPQEVRHRDDTAAIAMPFERKKNTLASPNVATPSAYYTDNEMPRQREKSTPQSGKDLFGMQSNDAPGLRNELLEAQKKAENLARHLVKAIGEKKMLQQNVEQLEELVEECNFEVGRLQQVVEEQSQSTVTFAGVQAALRAKEREVTLCEEEIKRLSGIVDHHVLRLAEQGQDSAKDDNYGLAARTVELEVALVEVGVAHVAQREAEERADQLASELESAVEQIQLLDQRLAEMERATAAARLKSVRDLLGAESGKDSVNSHSSDGSIQVPSQSETANWPLEARRAIAAVVSHAEGLLLQNSESSRHASMRMQHLEHTCEDLRRLLSDKNEELSNLQQQCRTLSLEKSAIKSHGDQWFRQLKDIKDDATLVSEIVRTSREEAEDVTAICKVSAASIQMQGQGVGSTYVSSAFGREKDSKVASFAQQVMQDLHSVSRFLFALREMDIGEQDGYQILLNLANGSTPDQKLFIDRRSSSTGRSSVPMTYEDAQRHIRERKEFVIEAVERALHSPSSLSPAPNSQHRPYATEQMHTAQLRPESQKIDSYADSVVDNRCVYGEQADEYEEPDAFGNDDDAEMEIASELRFSSESKDRHPSTNESDALRHGDNGIVSSSMRQKSEHHWSQGLPSHPQVTVTNQHPSQGTERVRREAAPSTKEPKGQRQQPSTAAAALHSSKVKQESNTWSPDKPSTSPMPTPPSVSRPLHLGSTPMPENDFGSDEHSDGAGNEAFTDRVGMSTPLSTQAEQRVGKLSPSEVREDKHHPSSTPATAGADDSANLSVSDIPFEREEDEAIRRRARKHEREEPEDHYRDDHSTDLSPVIRNRPQALSSPSRDEDENAGGTNTEEVSPGTWGSVTPPSRNEGESPHSAVTPPPPSTASRNARHRDEDDYSPVIHPSRGNGGEANTKEGDAPRETTASRPQEGNAPPQNHDSSPLTSYGSYPKERSTTNKPASQDRANAGDESNDDDATQFFGGLRSGTVKEARPAYFNDTKNSEGAAVNLLDEQHSLPFQRRQVNDYPQKDRHGLPPQLPPLHPGSAPSSSRSTPAQTNLQQQPQTKVLPQQQQLHPVRTDSKNSSLPKTTLVPEDDDYDDYEPSLHFYVQTSSANSSQPLEKGENVPLPEPPQHVPLRETRLEDSVRSQNDDDAYRNRRLLPGERISRDSSINENPMDGDLREVGRRSSSQTDTSDAIALPRLQRSANASPLFTDITHAPDSDTTRTPVDAHTLMEPQRAPTLQQQASRESVGSSLYEPLRHVLPVVRRTVTTSEASKVLWPTNARTEKEPEVVIQVDEDELTDSAVPTSRTNRGGYDMEPVIRSTTATPLSSFTNRTRTQQQREEEERAEPELERRHIGSSESESAGGALSLPEPASGVPVLSTAMPQPAEPLSAPGGKSLSRSDRPQRAGGTTLVYSDSLTSSLPRVNEDDVAESEVTEARKEASVTSLDDLPAAQQCQDVDAPHDKPGRTNDEREETDGDGLGSTTSSSLPGPTDASTKRREEVAKILERLRIKKEMEQQRKSETDVLSSEGDTKE